MSKTSIRSCAMALFGLLAAPAIGAAETGFYVGGFYGTSEKDEAQGPFDAEAAGVHEVIGFTANESSTRFDNKDKAYGFIGGYRLFENLALEGGYISLGTVAYRNRAAGAYPDTPTDIAWNVDSEIGGIALSALGVLPVSYRWELYGRAGVLLASHKYKFFIADSFDSDRGESTENATDLLAGIGASFLLAEVYTVRAEFMRVFDAGNKDFGEGDVDLLTVGITVKF